MENSMTKQEQIKFVNGLIMTVGSKIVEKIEQGAVPENWDGFELRWYIADQMSNVVWGDMKNKRSKRYKEYHNDTIVNNL